MRACYRWLIVLATLVATACGSTAGGAATTASPTATPEAAVTTTGSTDRYAVLEANQCLGCHIAGDRGNAVAGPSLNGLAARIGTYNLTVSAEAYIYESLVNPGAFLSTGCPTGQCANVMPSYADRMNQDELNALVAFLRSLPDDAR